MKAYLIAAMFCCVSSFVFGQTPASESTDSVYYGSGDSVIVQPQYPGGLKELYMFIGTNINYPRLARDNGIEGVVYVAFTVEADGTITDPEIIQGIGAGCDEEVLRVVGLLPKWIPGTLNGLPVSSEYSLPVKFSLEGFEDNSKKKKKNSEGVLDKQ